MNNDIVQLTDKNGNNVFPIAGAATQDSISKSMLEEGVFEGPELFPAPAEAYVRTNDIVDGAVTSDKIDWTTLGVLGDYSLQEMETPFKDWNGDTIYRRIVDCGALPNTTFKYVPLATVGVIKRILRLSGISYSPSLVTYLNLPMANPNANLAVSLAASPNDGSLSLAIGTGSDRSGFTQTYVEVLYTKN